MKRDEDIHFKIPKELKIEAKRLAIYDNRTLSGFIVEAVKDRIKKLKIEEKRAG